MFEEFLTSNGHMILPIISLILFFASFIGILIYVLFGLRDRDKLAHLETLPLDSEIAGAAEPSVGNEGRTN